MKAFCKDCKAINGAISLDLAENTFLNLFVHVRQLFALLLDIRKILYTTNVIQAYINLQKKVSLKIKWPFLKGFI